MVAAALSSASQNDNRDGTAKVPLALQFTGSGFPAVLFSPVLILAATTTDFSTRELLSWQAARGQWAGTTGSAPPRSRPCAARGGAGWCGTPFRRVLRPLTTRVRSVAAASLVVTSQLQTYSTRATTFLDSLVRSGISVRSLSHSVLVNTAIDETTKKEEAVMPYCSTLFADRANAATSDHAITGNAPINDDVHRARQELLAPAEFSSCFLRCC